MKKFVTMILIILCISTSAYSAGNSNRKYDSGSHQTSDVIIQAGMGFGMYGAEGDMQIPPIGVSAEYVMYINQEFPVSAGGTVAYASSEKKTATPFGYWVTTYTYTIVAFRAAWYYSKLFKTIPSEFDLYIGGILGWAFASVKEDPSPGIPEAYPAPLSKGSYMLPGIFIGGRYYITQTIGIFGEAGFGTGYVTLGLVTKW